MSAFRVETPTRQRSLKTVALRPKTSVPKPPACPAKKAQARHTAPLSSAPSGVFEARFDNGKPKSPATPPPQRPKVLEFGNASSGCA